MRRALAAALLGALLLGPVHGAAGRARTQRGPVQISVSAGHEGLFVPGTWSPVTVQLEASRAFRGELQVAQTSESGFRATRALAVEVPAGGLKEYDLLVPPFPHTSSSLAVSVVEGETILASRRTRLAAAEGSLLVGVLAEEIPDGLDGVVSPISGETVSAVPLTDRLLTLGPWALDGLAYVVADAERLAALPPDAQESAANWVALGGRLVVTGLDITRPGWSELVPALGGPEDLGPPPSGPSILGGRASVYRRGLGELIGVIAPLRSVDLGSRRWGELLRPVARTQSGAEGGFFGEDPSVNPDLTVARSLRGSIEADPRLGWLVAFLAAYLVLVGPVNYVALKRLKRRELAWVTVPGLALLFSAAGFGLVRGTEEGLEVQSAGIVFASNQGGSGRLVVTASSGGSGSSAVGFDSPAAGASTLVSGPGSSSTTRLTSEGSEVLLEDSPFSVTVAHGAIESFRGHLEARLSWDGAAYSGVITNRTPYQITGAGVRLGGTLLPAGEVAPGQSVDVSIPAARPGRRRTMVDCINCGRRVPLRRSLLLTLSSLAKVDVLLRTPLVYGFAEDFDGAVVADGTAQGGSGRVLVTSPVSFASGAKLVPDSSGRTDLVQVEGFISPYELSRLNVEEFREVVIAHTLPAAVDPARVRRATARIELGGSNIGIQVFDFQQGRWVEVSDRSDGATELDLPVSAVSELGEIYLKLTPKEARYLSLGNAGVEVELR